MFCGECGKQIKDDARFCPMCGAKQAFLETELQPVQKQEIRQEPLGILGGIERCPVCGEPVSGMMNIKIQNKVRLCKSCSKKCDIEQSKRKFMTAEDIKEHIRFREENAKLYQNFHPTNGKKGFGDEILEDSNMCRWCVRPWGNFLGPEIPTLYRYEDIVSCELIQDDGNAVSKGGLGGAVVGGALFGGVGAVVGSTASKKKIITRVKDIHVTVTLNHPYHSSLMIFAMPYGQTVSTESPMYTAYINTGRELVAFFETMMAKSKPSSNATIQGHSDADEIRKFKALLDEGIITQEQFEMKKKQILGV